MTENRLIAQEVIEAVGGTENIQSVAHCATRLRIMVKDKEKIDEARVENIDKVKGAFFNSGQFQIIFGTGTVNKIYEEVSKLGVNEVSKSEMKEEFPIGICSITTERWTTSRCSASTFFPFWHCSS